MSDKSATPDGEISRVAARQHGVVSVRQLRAAGLDQDAVSYRCKAGRLHRVHQGVYAVGHDGISNGGRWMAAVLACGHQRDADAEAGDSERSAVTTILARWGATLSHRSAAELWGLLSPQGGPVHVSVPGEAGRKRRKGIRVHRCSSLVPAFATSHQGIPVTTPARTISDLQRAAKDPRWAVSEGELRRAIRQAEVLGRPIGSGAVGDRTRSELEHLFLRLCRRHRLPMPEVNVRIGGMTVDFLWRVPRLVVETDGYRFHRGRAAFEDDRARDLRLRALGYEVIRLSYRQVVDEPRAVAATLKKVLGSGP